MRRSVDGLGGLGSSSLSGATATGVEVEAGCPFRELEKGSFVRLMGVCGCGCEPEGVADEAIGERARVFPLSGEHFNCCEADIDGVGEVALGGDNCFDSAGLLLSVVVLVVVVVPVVVAVVIAVLLVVLLVVVVGKLRLCNRLLP